MENPLIRAELSKPGGVATRLTEARTRANLSGRDLAHRSGLITSKISKLAGGYQLPTAADVHAWMTACNADPQAIRDLQTEVERVRRAVPILNRAGRPDGRSLEWAHDGITPASLDDAFKRGYAAAIRDMQRSLSSMTLTAPPAGRELAPDGKPQIAQMAEG
jgi:transcriptional regulator with XRE-family HTH domain